MEKGIKELKNKMKKDLQKQKIEMQKTKVRFPTHTTNVYHSTFIQPSVVPMSSDSLHNFTPL